MDRLDGGTALPNEQAYEVAVANFVSIKKETTGKKATTGDDGN